MKIIVSSAEEVGFNIAKQLSYGVTIAGIIQLIFLIYISWEFYKPSLVFKFKLTNKISEL